MEYRQPIFHNQIQGLDLKLDTHTQKICETYNQSSAATRSILYVMLLISVIALVAVFNSNPFYNWPKERVNSFSNKIIKNDSLLRGQEQRLASYETAIRSHGKSPEILRSITEIRRSIETNKIDSIILLRHMEAFVRTQVDYYSVKVQIIGIQIDINDLAAITALAIIVLLYLLKFTLVREKSNLSLAFNAISERYPHTADFKYFQQVMSNERHDPFFGPPETLPILKAEEEIPTLPENIRDIIQKEEDERNKLPEKEQWRQYIADINFTRRRSHYNFLSMNEIFNLPYLDIGGNKFQSSITGKVVNRFLFYFFFAIYTYILFNDFCSYDAGVAVHSRHTFVIMSISIIGYFFIFYLCQVCVNEKHAVSRLFNDFYQRQYFYDYSKDYSPTPSTWPVRYVLPVILLGMMLFFSAVVRHNGNKVPTKDFTDDFFRNVFPTEKDPTVSKKTDTSAKN